MLSGMWQYLFQRQTMTPPPARNQYQFSVFFKLPPEVRLIIYSDLIKSGNLEVLRLCQKTHKEAIGTVSRDGIYRVTTREAADLYFGDAALPGARDETNRIRKEIQNVEVYTDLKNVTSVEILRISPEILRISNLFPGKVWTKPEFIPPGISGKNCWIYLTHHDMTTEMHLNMRLAIMVRAVQQFDNVFLNFPGSISQSNDPSGSFLMEHFSNLDKFGMLLKELDKLGPPTWRDNTDPMKRYLIFHPRQACPEWYLTTEETDGEPTWQRWRQSWLVSEIQSSLLSDLSAPWVLH